MVLAVASRAHWSVVMSTSEPRPSRLQAWWRALRPQTLIASIGPIFVASALAFADGCFDPTFCLGAFITLVLLQVASNLINDVADFRRGADGPDRLGPPRALAQGWIGQRALILASVSCLVCAAASGLYLVHLSNGYFAVGLVAATLAFVLYTAGPLPLAYVGLGDVLVFGCFGLGAVGGTYYGQAGVLSDGSLAASTAIGFLVTAILVVNNLRDIDSDRRVGKKTLIVRFGVGFGHAQYAVLIVGAYATVLIASHITRDWGWCVPLLSLSRGFRQVSRTIAASGVALNPHLGKTAKLGLEFSLLLTIGLLLSHLLR